ncbi:guanine nucleotide-binding protein alpha-2 subunit [Leucosporidium creatinivorum]|uniref:Guanine nucleotide-binding protein alpha-2 subunit n=1 Tax=Leucosporidium creatinivorum TaxID=106004 RepID=A0A1Y2C2F9_9BASI|nr:guanine nucleotide-binding protein alpha-2 subunit [Leucosporidium creatinivorum]
MGACGSTETAGGAGAAPIASEEEMRASRSIDKMLRDEEKRLSRQVKMLLLGPGSSGKSTILKQMKVIHLKGFNQAELESYRQQIFVNIYEAMAQSLALLKERGIPLEHDSNAQYYHLFEGSRDLKDREPFPQEFFEPMRRLWADAGVQECVATATEASVPENMSYFYANLDRLFASSGFVPTDQDVLRCRQRTTGITETTFNTSELQYRLFDVGGQRSERKKWIHCFENVTAILFLAAVSGYDQPLLEDKDSNQMQEALMLFDSICNSQWFVQTSIILFLNKVDIFKERILVSSIKSYFPDYTGDDTDYNAAREYFKARFTRLNRSQSKEIYANYTTAIDTNLVRVVMASVYDIVLTRNLNEIIL